MFICCECQGEFESPNKIIEKHSLDTGPYEVGFVCPYCNSSNFKTKAYTHCRCCGAKLLDKSSDYCSEDCKIRGRMLLKNETLHNPLNMLIRELERYNKTHSTNYSYGQYVAITVNKRRKQECAKQKKDI